MVIFLYLMIYLWLWIVPNYQCSNNMELLNYLTKPFDPMQTDNNSNKTLLEDLLAKASKQWGVAPEEIQKAMDKIAFHESKGVVDAIQKSDKNKTGIGPGRGLFQFEKTEGGSGAFQTALNRLENVHKKHIKGEGGVPSWIEKAKSHDDATKLSREQQEELLLADLAMKSGSDKYINEALSTGSAKNLWLNKHWAGAEQGSEGYIKKGKQWEREMETYKAQFKDNSAEEIVGLIAQGKPIG